MEKLTERQQGIYDFIKSYIAERSYSPTVREIGAAVGLSSTSTVHAHIKALIKKGYIVFNPSTQRTIAIAEPAEKQRNDDMVEVSRVGTVAAGSPIFAFDDVKESLTLPASLLHGGNKEDTFILDVKGDSMVDVGINSGDMIVVNRGLGAENGDIVVARLCGDTATVKRIFYEKSKLRLQPENSGMEPIYADYNDVEIIGKVVALIRRY